MQAASPVRSGGGDPSAKLLFAPDGANSLRASGFDIPEWHAVADCECELANDGRTEIRLREALARSEALHRKKDARIQYYEVLSQESDHRLLNSLQMISSLLAMQSRASKNAETASELAIAAGRIAMIDRVHRRLHSIDGSETVAFTQYLKDFCRDFSAMVFSQNRPEQGIAVKGLDIELPTVTAIPLGFIANELITNAVKNSRGQITVRLDANPEKGLALSVSNDGAALPADFDPAASTGLGMKIIRSFANQIGGELRFGRGDNNEGSRFTVLFP